MPEGNVVDFHVKGDDEWLVCADTSSDELYEKLFHYQLNLLHVCPPSSGLLEKHLKVSFSPKMFA